MPKTDTDDVVHLLWTGGWDSTFRLLQLLHDTDARIQSHYLIDEKRASTPREIETMRSIRQSISDRLPDAAERLLSTRYGGGFDAITIEPHHRRQWEGLNEYGNVGYQYPNLASYAEQNDIPMLELSVEQHVEDGFSLASHIKPLVEMRDTAAGDVPVLPEQQDGPEAMLKYFAFPLMEYTKLDMQEEAKRRGWMSILKKTWFCFNPVMGLPCGSCHPCTIAKEEGMGWRVGRLGPALHQPRKWKKKISYNSRVWGGTVLRKLGVKRSIDPVLRQLGLKE